MKDEVMSPKFWKERLSKANKLRESVFYCSDFEWRLINEHHYKVLKNTIDVKNDKVLEVGCGFGRWSPLFINYTGVDISPDFISLAKQNYPLHKDNFSVQDIRQLSFEDNSFDWCFTISTKEMIIREEGNKIWDTMENEILRVSKNLLILEYTKSLPNNPHRDNLQIISK